MSSPRAARRGAWRLWCAAAVLLQGLATGAAAQSKHVVLVSIDGLSNSYLKDPKAKLTTIRQLAEAGATAEAMVTTFPSLTWPAHISLITGVSPAKHGVVSNVVIDRKTLQPLTYIGDPFFTKDDCVMAPTLYDVVHAAKMKTASIIWPATNGAKTLDWAIPDSNLQRIHDRYTTPGLADELEAANLSIRKLGVWGWDHRYSAARDATYTDVAIHLLLKHQPNLLMLHLVTPDGFEHDHGPHCEEAYWACQTADERIRQLWEAIESSPLKGKVNLFIVSDHGFAEYTQVIHLNAVFKQLGLIEVDEKDNKIKSQLAWAHSNGGSAGIYIFEQDPKKYSEIYKKIVSAVSRQRGVAAVLKAAEFTKLGLPDPHDDPEQPELMISAEAGYAFANGLQSATDTLTPAEGRRGAHGHLPDQDFMHALLVAAGPDIKPKSRVGKISINDVAPTIAQILGVSLPEAEGRVLKEILK